MADPLDSVVGAAEGVLSAYVWPVYVGMSVCDPGPLFGSCEGEPFYHVDYQRGQIMWAVMPGGVIVGRARIIVPAGTYTFLTYHNGPSVWPAGPQLVGKRQLEFAMHFPAASAVDVDPINNGDWSST